MSLRSVGLFLFLCLAWLLLFLGSLAKLTWQRRQAGLPARGSSFLPVVPLMAWICLSLSRWVDRHWAGQGTRALLLIHGALILWNLGALSVYQRRLAALDAADPGASGGPDGE